MLDSLIVTAWLILYGQICVAFSFLRIPKLFNKYKQNGTRLGPLITVRVVIMSIGAYIILLVASIWLVRWYVVLSFIILYTIPFLWIFLLQKSVLRRLSIVLIGGSFFIWWITNMNNNTTHNIFLIWSIAWVGIVIARTKLLTVRRFMIFSLCWLIYDMVFVWFTPASTALLKTLKHVDFPLWILWGRSGIGTGDLIYMSLLVGQLVQMRSRMMSVIILAATSFGIYIWSYFTHISFTFPLLVVWAPLGILMINFSDQRKL